MLNPLPEEEECISLHGLDCQPTLCTVAPLRALYLLSSIGEDSLAPLLYSSQVHQHGGYTLAPITLLRVHCVVEVVVVGLIFLAINIMEDLHAFTIVLRNV